MPSRTAMGWAGEEGEEERRLAWALRASTTDIAWPRDWERAFVDPSMDVA
jgi:hypothetical protein